MKNLLSSILDYCTQHRLILWVHNTGPFYKIYIGAEQDLEKHTKSLSPHMPPASRITAHWIEEWGDTLVMGHAFTSNTTIEAYPPWAQKNSQLYSQLMVHVFWNNPKEISKIFIERYARFESLSLAHAVEYTDQQYPKGFLDPKLQPYPKEKNWYHFIEAIPTTRLVALWENQNNLDDFHNALKRNPLEKNHSLLRHLTDEITKHDLSDNAKLKSAHMVLDVLPPHQHAWYAQKFPYIKLHIDSIRRDSLFPQQSQLISEKIALPYNHIYDYFKEANLQAKQYIKLCQKCLSIMGNNQQLKEQALDSIDTISSKSEQAESLIVYINHAPESLLNQATFKQLFIFIMESALSSDKIKKELLKENSLTNDTALDRVVEQSISKWLLEQQLPAPKTNSGLSGSNSDARKIKI